jgi:hypothetical protein
MPDGARRMLVRHVTGGLEMPKGSHDACRIIIGGLEMPKGSHDACRIIISTVERVKAQDAGWARRMLV